MDEQKVPTQNENNQNSPQLEGARPPIEYVVARHVAVLDEHPMSSGPDGTPTYCGPKELQQIADNNNKRVHETGDACPIVIGHTVDGKPEKAQPEVVGYATNFTTGPLFNSGRMGLFADFHIRKDKIEEVNKYPRRSVELWPKRWEVDPISLLGATTPERDLGLLQMQRQGEHPTRYSRALTDKYSIPLRYSVTSTPLDNRKYAMNDMNGQGEDMAKLVAAVMQSAPMQELTSGFKQVQDQQGEMMSLLQQVVGGQGQGQPGMGEPDGDEGAPQPQGQPGQGEQGAGGSPEQDQRFIHEGEPERYDEGEEMDEENPDPDHPMDSEGDGSPEDGEAEDEAHYCTGGRCDHPCHGKVKKGPQQYMDDEEEPEQYAHDEEVEEEEEPNQYSGAGFASATNDYIPTTSAIKKSRKSNDPVWNNYVNNLRKGDKVIRNNRKVDETAQLKARVRDLEIDRIKYSRAAELALVRDAEGIDMDVAEEVELTQNWDDKSFAVHVERIKQRYQRDPSRIQPIRVTASEGTAGISPESRMSREELVQYSRAVADRAAVIRGAGSNMSIDEAIEKAKEEVSKKLNTRK